MIKLRRLALLSVFLYLALFRSAAAQTTELVYQGQLQSSSALANGSFDFEFVLFDAAVGGSQFGPPQARNSVTVANGIFSVNLDFGASFSGATRFLEIRVRQSGIGAFTVLSPRQTITSAPYSIKSLSAETASNAVNATNAVAATNFTGELSGDVSGTQGATTVARLQGRNVANTAPTDGQVLKFNIANNRWQPDTDNTGSGGGGGTITGITPGTGLTGGGTTGNVSVSIANGGVGTNQIADNSVTDAKINGVSGAKVTGNVATATNATQLGGVAANQYVVTTDPRMTDARTPTAGSPNYIQNGSIVQPATSFNISGTGRADIFSAASQYNLGADRVLSAGAGAQTNTSVGLSSGPSNISSENAFFGNSAGRDNTGGGGNSFFGLAAGMRVTTGFGNSYFGVSTGRDNLTGQNNSFYGWSSGVFATSGSNNTLFGANTSLTSGLTFASAIGARAQVSQSNSLVLGAINGVNGATADTNVGIGTTTPAHRLHVVGNGLFTGDLTVNGTLNAGLPSGSSNYIQNQNATQQVSSNFNISGVGKANVLDAVTQFNLNGFRVLSNQGNNNLFAGANAGQANTSGSENSFFGRGAGLSNTTGNQNSFFGESAGAGQSGGQNAFFGARSGSANSSSRNSFFGMSSGQTNTLGTQNTFVGYGAGSSNISGSDNTFLGSGAGFGNTTGSQNTFLGSNAIGTVGITNATAIGAQAQVGASNSLVLGGITGVNNGVSTNVGIGTITPRERLDVAGNGVFTGSLYANELLTANYGIVSGGSLGGIYVTSGNGRAVEAISTFGTGGYFVSSAGAGVVARSTSGYAINARSENTHALFADGSILVNRWIVLNELKTGGGTALCRNSFNEIASCSASSLRYKENIGTFNYGLDVLKKMRPITFDWRSDSTHDIGLAAEDVEKVAPQLVVYEKGKVEGVKYDKIGMVLINAVKEQQGQIEKQQKQIERQEAVNRKQQNEIVALKSLVCTRNRRAAICQTKK